MPINVIILLGYAKNLRSGNIRRIFSCLQLPQTIALISALASKKWSNKKE